MISRTWLLTAIFIVSQAIHPDCQAQFNPIERINVRSSGSESSATPTNPAISTSTDGRYVVFASTDDNLVDGDSNGVSDIFLVDRDSDTISRVSVDTDGGNPDAASFDPSISGDGRYIVFYSMASDLVSDDTNANADVFLVDTQASTVTLISQFVGGSEANGNSINPVISQDGAFVAFESAASNLIGSDPNGVNDVFVYNRVTPAVSLVSQDSSGGSADGASGSPSISADGDKIVFESDATDHVSGDDNDSTDIFVYDMSDDAVTIVSVDDDEGISNGDSLNGVVSLDGSMVAFDSEATDLVSGDSNGNRDVFIRDLSGGTTERVSLRNSGFEATGGDSSGPAIDQTGRFIAFVSSAEDLVTDDDNGVDDVFVRDLTDEETVRISVSDVGSESNGASSQVQLNQDAHFAAFISESTTFVTGDANQLGDLFVINTQCLLTPPGVSPLDTDSDGTNDCSDACPTDSNKTAAGACGCGVADTDTDGDGTADCNDDCDSDPAKTEVGDCGCGVADTDADGNGVSDCLDPTADTVPNVAQVVFRRVRGRLVVRIPSQFNGVRYLIIVRRGRTVLARRRTSLDRQVARFGGLSAGAVRVRYRIILPSGGRSRPSPAARIRIPG